MSKPTAAVVITAKNRKDELRVALTSAVSQTANPEVLVIDDGSTDGTSDMVRAEFPQVHLDRVEKSLGLIVQRNRGARLVKADVIFSIDDDAIFTTPRVIEQTLLDFDHPRVGAVAIPFFNVKKENIKLQAAPSNDGVYLADSYIGTAHALKRELFLKLRGYREYLFHQGEEGDYAIRMLDAGHVVRLGRSEPIHHFESPKRDFRRVDLYGRRNDVLFAWYNAPFVDLPKHLAGTTIRGIQHGYNTGRLGSMLKGLTRGYACMIHEIAHRQPVRRETYRLFRMLKTKPRRLEEIEPLLRPIAE